MEEIKNCWEYKKCGREKDGEQDSCSKCCPASVEEKYDGVNRGKNAGRFCWAVAGTLANGEAQGVFHEKFFNVCIKCPFYREVERQEGRFFVLSETGLKERPFYRNRKKL